MFGYNDTLTPDILKNKKVKRKKYRKLTLFHPQLIPRFEADNDINNDSRNHGYRKPEPRFL